MPPHYLINDDILPSKLLQVRFLPENHLVTGNTDVEFFIDQPLIYEVMALVLCSLQDKYIYLRCPFGKLSLPVVQSRFRDSDQMRSCNAHDVAKISQECNSLECFAESHLIGQNTRDTILM